MQGPGIKAGDQLPANDILDLAPTIMHFLGEAVPRVMDGRVLAEIFSDAQDVVYDEGDGHAELVSEKGFSSDEASQVEDRLRGLGYL